MKVSEKEVLDAVQRAFYTITDDRSTLDMILKYCIASMVTGKSNNYADEMRDRVLAEITKTINLEF